MQSAICELTHQQRNHTPRQSPSLGRIAIPSVPHATSNSSHPGTSSASRKYKSVDEIPLRAISKAVTARKTIAAPGQPVGGSGVDSAKERKGAWSGIAAFRTPAPTANGRLAQVRASVSSSEASSGSGARSMKGKGLVEAMRAHARTIPSESAASVTPPLVDGHASNSSPRTDPLGDIDTHHNKSERQAGNRTSKLPSRSGNKDASAGLEVDVCSSRTDVETVSAIDDLEALRSLVRSQQEVIAL